MKSFKTSFSAGKVLFLGVVVFLASATAWAVEPVMSVRAVDARPWHLARFLAYLSGSNLLSSGRGNRSIISLCVSERPLQEILSGVASEAGMAMVGSDGNYVMANPDILAGVSRIEPITGLETVVPGLDFLDADARDLLQIMSRRLPGRRLEHAGPLRGNVGCLFTGGSIGMAIRMLALVRHADVIVASDVIMVSARPLPPMPVRVVQISSHAVAVSLPGLQPPVSGEPSGSRLVAIATLGTQRMALLQQGESPRFLRPGDRFDEVTRVKEIGENGILLEDLEQGITRALAFPSDR